MFMIFARTSTEPSVARHRHQVALKGCDSELSLGEAIAVCFAFLHLVSLHKAATHDLALVVLKSR